MNYRRFLYCKLYFISGILIVIFFDIIMWEGLLLVVGLDVCGGWFNVLLELVFIRVFCFLVCFVFVIVLVILFFSFFVLLFLVFEKKIIRFILLNVVFD